MQLWRIEIIFIASIPIVNSSFFFYRVLHLFCLYSLHRKVTGKFHNVCPVSFNSGRIVNIMDSWFILKRIIEGSCKDNHSYMRFHLLRYYFPCLKSKRTLNMKYVLIWLKRPLYKDVIKTICNKLFLSLNTILLGIWNWKKLGEIPEWLFPGSGGYQK